MAPQIVADQLTLSQLGGGGLDYAQHITICLPPPRIFRPSYAYDPAMYRHMTAKKSI